MHNLFQFRLESLNLISRYKYSGLVARESSRFKPQSHEHSHYIHVLVFGSLAFASLPSSQTDVPLQARCLSLCNRFLLSFAILFMILFIFLKGYLTTYKNTTDFKKSWILEKCLTDTQFQQIIKYRNKFI